MSCTRLTITCNIMYRACRRRDGRGPITLKRPNEALKDALAGMLVVAADERPRETAAAAAETRASALPAMHTVQTLQNNERSISFLHLVGPLRFLLVSEESGQQRGGEVGRGRLRRVLAYAVLRV